MAEIQLEVLYRPPRLRRLFEAFSRPWYVWLIVLPAILQFAAAIDLLLHGLQFDSSMLEGTAWFGLYVGLTCIGISISQVGQDFKVRLSKEGISLPAILFLGHKVPTDLIWAQVKETTVIGAADQARLVFTLDSGRQVPLMLSAFTKNEVEQVLLATELWGTSAKRSPELIEYQTSLQNELRGVGHQSYTQMWEDELDRRFRSTSFIPLSPQHKLQDGRLTVIRQLAFGGLSAIYLVQKEDQKLFVLKEAAVPCNADQQIRREAEKHLSRESQLLFALDHPAIAKVHDYFVEDGRSYLLLDHVNGQDLRQFVRQNGPQPVLKVRDWALQLANALAYLHGGEPPLVHRDLTPDNIVLCNSGSVTIIDFGAANEFIGTATGTLIGKQAYIAPEQLRGKASCQSDLYSLGATIYFLLTGREPLPLSRSSPRLLITDLPSSIDQLVMDLTELEPTERIQSADELVDRLAHVLAES